MDYLQEDYPPSSPSKPPQQSQLAPTTPSQIYNNPNSESPPDDILDPSPHTPRDPYDGMPPPPISTYPSLNELMAACQTHARAHGYACVTSSNNHKRGIAYVRCDRGGQYANHWKLTPETRTRHNRTRRLVGCRWKARAKQLKSGEWELRMMEDRHSGHGRSEDARLHPSLRKLGDEAVDEARRLFRDGRSPKEILGVLRGWNASLTAQDVYNLKAKISREVASGGLVVKGRGKGPIPTNGGDAEADAMNGIQTDEEYATVDPALHAQSGGLAPVAGGFHETLEKSADGHSTTRADNPAAATRRGKCECKCCEH